MHHHADVRICLLKPFFGQFFHFLKILISAMVPVGGDKVRPFWLDPPRFGSPTQWVPC